MTYVKQLKPKEKEEFCKPIKCLDAFAATGMAGFQWKHYLKDKVVVTSNELDATSYRQLEQNAKLNDFDVTTAEMNQAPGDGKCVELSNKDCNIVMYERQFHFIHLDPFGTCVQYLEAAFRNVYSNGVVVVTSTDVAALLGKCEQVTLRNYGAYTTKCDYRKEVAVRILISALARAAAHCHKGITVLYSVYLEHFVQVAVRVERGAQNANDSINKIAKVIHCQRCHEFSYVPYSLAPIEHPYSLLRCDCNARVTPSKTAVLLGPMWTGVLHDAHFVQEACSQAIKSDLSGRLIKNLENIVKEANCYMEAISSCGPGGEPLTKKIKQSFAQICEECPEPLFYFSLQERKLHSIDIPKVHKLIALLNAGGFYASLTNFESQSIKTNASLKQITTILTKYCNQKSH